MSDPVNGFQDTSQGPLPKAWKITQLNEVLTQQVRKVKVEPAQKYTRLGVHWYAAGPFKKDEVLGEEIKSKYLYTVEPEEFIYNRLFGWKGSFGIISEDMVDCYVSSEFPVFQVVRERADPWYLWRWFSQPSVWKNIEDRSRGSTRTSRLRFKIEDLLTVAVPLPSIPEQRAIAKTLCTVQQAREASERVVEAARELKRSLMRHLFTYGPTSVAQADRVELQETEIGQVPSHWKSAKLEEIADIVYGAQTAVSHLNEKSPGVPILTNVNITNEGLISLEPVRCYEVPEAKRERLILRKGDVLFNWRSGSQAHVGKTALFDLEGEYTFSSFILRFRVTSDVVDSRFLRFYLHFIRAQGYFSQKRQQSSVNSVFNASLSAQIPILLPPLEEQRRITHLLITADAKITAEEARRDALDDLFHTLLHHLMTAKVRVPLQ